MIAPMNGDFNKGEYRLVWKMTIAVDGKKIGNYEYFVDAQTGEIINKFNSMPHAVGSGESNYNGTVTIYSKRVTNIYQMIDTIRSIKTYTANNTTTNPGVLLIDADNYWDSNSDAVDAHWGLGKVYDFYKNVFNRNSFNGSGAEIIGTVNYLFDYGGGVTSPNNAQWNGAQMLFGSGDGSEFSSVTSLDIAGHEFTHAVTDYTADLIYQGESGAINEAISDIFGTAIEFYATPAKANWLIGEECYTPGTGGDALRYMNNPNAGNQPDTYEGTYWGDPTSGHDYGYVHTNSGVLNYAFYLMTAGGSGTNDNGDPFNITGIGLTKTRAIAYRVLTTYFTPSDYYIDARERFLSAASDLYGSLSTEYRAVSDAFGAVGVGVRYIAKNNFNAGVIKINGYTTASGSSFFATDGNPQTLEAIEQYYSPYNYVWNTMGSTWRKKPIGDDEIPIPGATNISYNFTASSSDHNATYIADLKKVYNITRNDQSLESGSTFNTINVQVIEGNSLLAPSTQTVGGITYSFIDWSDGVTQNPRVITSPTSPLTARYKALQHSNDVVAFSNNGQRKLIETKSGGVTWLHQVYSSMGHVWIEHSSNGGSSWVLGNNGQPLDGTAGGKNPSIAYSYNSVNNYNYIGVVWQQPYSSTYKIMGKMFNQNTASSSTPTPVSYVRTLHTEPSDAYSVNANPNLVLPDEGFPPYFVTFERKSTSGGWQPGINWLVGHIENVSQAYCGPFDYVEDTGIVSGTNASTINTQISLYPGYDLAVNLIRQQGSPGKVYNHYLNLYESGGTWYYSQVDDGLISYNANVNSGPSVSSLPSGYYSACWIEYNDMVFYYFGNQVRYYYGDYVQSCSINRGGGSSNDGFAVWSQNPSSNWSNKSIRFDNGVPTGTISTLSTSGKYVKVGNGASSGTSNMYVSSFYPFSSPYHFSTTSNPLSKVSAELVTGRGFEINNGDATFRYRFEDLNVDGENIGFIDVPDTADYGKLEVLNNALVTESFPIKTNSKIIFTEHSGFLDSTAATEKLGKDGYVNYKVELMDDATGKAIGIVKKVELTSSNAYSLREPSFILNTEELSGKTVRIKITLETNLIAVTDRNDEDFARFLQNDKIPISIRNARRNASRSNIILTKSFADKNHTLAKSSFNELTMESLEMRTEYSLAQNYPNPFNPTTTINYQIPQDGLVTLKIYNTLGQQITTLVDEYKSTGKYQVKFDASGLASGVYIYRIESGEYTEAKRMILLK